MIKQELKDEIIKTLREFIPHRDSYCVDDLATALLPIIAKWHKEQCKECKGKKS